jgi:hypothetical protein
MEDTKLKLLKKLVAVLMLVALIASAVPVALAAEEDNRQGLDYSELERQIGIANGLNSYEYTKESWEALQKAVEVGNQRLGGVYNQGKLDRAAKDIEDAIKALVKMDYSALIRALDMVYAKIDETPEKHDLWYRLDKAVDKARPLLISGDQIAVNEAAVQLEAILRELESYVEPTEAPQIVIQEVEVEVPPVDDFCNIPKHRVWPVLFLISLVLNVAFLAVIVLILFVKRNTTDTIPLVSYDIDEDLDY